MERYNYFFQQEIKNKLTVITDPGVDDLVAVGLLSKLSPNNRHTLISTFGNNDEKITSRNAKEFIAAFSSNWLFFRGSSLPLNGKIEHPWPDYFHGPDGVWGVHPDCKVDNVTELEEFPRNSRLISLSPLKDTLLYVRDVSTKRTTVMGGAFNVEGNETLFSETNIAFDADASAEYFKKRKKGEVNVVPLDVTNKCFWTEEKIDKIPETSEQNIYYKKLLEAWYKNYKPNMEKVFYLYDPLAVYLHFFPKEAKWHKQGVKIVTEGSKRGQTLFDTNSPECNVAVDLFDGKKISQNIFELLFKS